MFGYIIGLEGFGSLYPIEGELITSSLFFYREGDDVKRKPVKKTIKKTTDKKVVQKELNEKQLLFCLYYVKNFNATMAYQKAYKCSYDNASSVAYRLLGNVGIKKEISRLKRERAKILSISKSDIVEKYIKIAFADISDYVDWGTMEIPIIGISGPAINPETGEVMTKIVNVVRFKDSLDVDGGVVCQVKQGKEGSSLKLEDRLKALDWLANYFDMNVMDKHKREYDKKRLELEMKKAGQEDPEINPDNEITEEDIFEKIDKYKELFRGKADDNDISK